MNVIGNFGIGISSYYMKNSGLNYQTNNFLPQAMQKSSITQTIKSNLINRDTVEISSQESSMPNTTTIFGSVPISIATKNDAKLSTEFTNNDVSETAKKLAELMDENNEDIKMKAWWGMNEEQLAEHFGNIGKQIDDAFSAGSITKQEYDDLNLGLEKYIETISSIAERGSATQAVVKQFAKELQSLIENGASDEEIENYANTIRETFQSKVDELIDKHSSIDRSLLFDLIERVRKGESLLPEKTKQTYGYENTIGYFNDEYKPFVLSKYV